MGADEASPAGGAEAAVKYHSCADLRLRAGREPAARQGQGGSLTGAVASQSVTEAPKGPLRANGHRPDRVQGHKGARLRGTQAEQGRKSGVVTQRRRVEGPLINGQKLPRG